MSAKPRASYAVSSLLKIRSSHTPRSQARHFQYNIALKSMFLTMALLLVATNAVMGSDPEDGLKSSGTGFAVSRQGHMLTNYHVVDNCNSIRVIVDREQQELTVIATDKKNDLAIVKLRAPLSNVARFRKGRNIRSGDSIVVVGFPFHGVLASEANVTTGTVSAMAGIGNDTRFLQITAPVQPGNSGGPVLDKSGHIVGIVESKLNALATALITGDVPQNVNFAIKDEMARLFLNSHSVAFETAVSDKHLEPAEIGETAKQFTFLLTCYSQKIHTQHAALLQAERRALEAERRVLDEERQALASARQRDQEEREFTLRLEQEQRALAAGKNVHQPKAVEPKATEQKRAREQVKTEVPVETDGSNERAFLSPEEERAREAKKKAERQALNAEPQRIEEARRKGHEARARALRSEEEENGQALANNPQRSSVSDDLNRGLEEELKKIKLVKPVPQQYASVPPAKTPEATLKISGTDGSNPYWARVQSIISSQWEPPQISMTGQTYTVIVKFRLQRDGTIKDVAIQQSSGNAYFDMAGQRAVLRPRVLPVFPADITHAHQDLTMAFTAGELGR